MSWPKGKKNLNHHMKQPKQRERMREMITGEHNPMKRPEVAAKVSKAQRGRRRPDVSERQRGIRFGNSTEQRVASSKRMKENNPMKRPEIVAKIKDENLFSRGPEVREKLRIFMLGKKRPEFSGENHPNWLGGRSFELYGISFNSALKEQIRQRDNYQCQECRYFQKDMNYKLDIHHIDYNKKNNDPVNLVSLCKSCHMKTNFNRNNWVNYYTNMASETINKLRKEE